MPISLCLFRLCAPRAFVSWVFALWAVIAALLSVAKAAPACPHGGRSVEFACLTWTEIAASLRDGTDTVILPVGGTEQSGPFIAVGKHDVRAAVLADEIARRVGHTLVAPVLAYVPEGSTTPRTGHMRFAGTLSIPPAAFEAVLEGAAESLRVQGFRRVVLLGDHGGYQSLLAETARRLNARWKGQAEAVFLRDYYRVVSGAYVDALRARGHGAEVGKHAELSDTSLMLAVDPSLVREAALRAAPKPGEADGVFGGDPRGATASLGEIGTRLQVDAAVTELQSFNRSHP